MNDKNFKKIDIALRFYLTGAHMNKALSAYNFAKQYHSSVRKDGVTPEFQHQVEIALYLSTLKGLYNEEYAIMIALLHDVVEDNPEVSYDDIEEKFGKKVVHGIKLISKKHLGIKTYNDVSEYYDRMAEYPEVALVKGVDRIHNLQSMNGVFSFEKQETYVEEAEKYFLPMLKKAANNDPRLFMAFMNVRTMMKNQISLIKASIQYGKSITAN